MDRRAALLTVVACATPPAPVANHVPDEPIELSIVMRQTACMGACPQFELVIRRDGEVRWTGIANVAALGTRAARVPIARLFALAAAVSTARFYDRDESGRIIKPVVCDANGCSLPDFTVCSDTSHTQLAVHRDDRIHEVDDAHCEVDAPLDALEDAIAAVARERGWI
jgi:hypothetical protein